ncbi:bifunctional proline dehydrogenase/L-glutamate gamma-semialdehyde dehydrogenase PutA [Aliiglaciecola sp. CAU 1673]|uniref:bifunctional proline dehydrogenase/L-glutamate gamma-semialdehyde dehydrogenase PutA n=1 Tax=Aliiglaciecola sp. CAU 1673 TaxID=3032595 RepID=UPI0023DCA631|nr:bifunctional proline dehydrogenase/L-glutamate gamma-semialdehyde dehydrogenase PutA [Aliiglaciecola sp. CAU 1673]MDF2178985.1 bifunctional proline dehydrogenase/L-glutamate gamma-semialdehyde dehydrogenase PutA [Aliiglaciecola sp. CAU 1673]
MFKASVLLNNQYQLPSLSELPAIISNNYIVDENAYLNELISLIPQEQDTMESLRLEATRLVQAVRKEAKGGDGIDAFLQQYSLDTNEGVILMCLAEALLRIPDAGTADALIKDKLSGADWRSHLKQSDSLLVNASTWGLMLTGKLFHLDKPANADSENVLDKLVSRLGEPVVRKAMYAAMKIMGQQFVLGRTIEEALKASRKQRKTGYTHSYDMLGEAALTADDAQKYFDAYANAIEAIGKESFEGEYPSRPTISIKLSALHPRYEVANEDRVMTEMADSVIKLVALARQHNVGVNIDAEEADRLELSLKLIEKVYRSEQIKGWGMLGIVVQAYSKRALPVLMWITQLAKDQGDTIPVRLVKGAYWDSEVKLCQQMGIEGYPVFTRKASTDVSYLACARYLLSEHTAGHIYPMFATHNAHTVTAIRRLASSRDFEFQRLHGMGEELYDCLLADNPGMNVRIYAPVGAHRDLLPYLVRRLLENGANSSFVHKLVDPDTPVESLVSHPLESLQHLPSLANDKIPLPGNIYVNRKNSMGTNLHIQSMYDPFMDKVKAFEGHQWQAGPIVRGKSLQTSNVQPVVSPQIHQQQVGSIHWADEAAIKQAIDAAVDAFPNWSRSSVEMRATALEKLADLMEEHKHELIALCTLEAGKLLQDGIDEVREAVDFCRYYAQEARKLFAYHGPLVGPTGELNELFVQGRGVFVCISPWNFPLAIFAGQIVAALVTGNTVIAKPAEQTSLIAHRAVQLMLQAGIPADVIQLLPGKGSEIGPLLTSDNRITGVCFTGSTDTAKAINRSLAERDGAIATLIAETGGQNAMIVDSTALPEQVVKDAVTSAFMSAGQRCSALRVLYVQEDVAERVIELLKGAMQELHVGDPMHYKTDVGPVIDAKAQANLQDHIDTISREGKLIAKAPMSAQSSDGSFICPTAVEIDSIRRLSKEHFGPILHVVRYQAKELNKVINEINATSFGLTLGIHTRNESRAAYIADMVNVGNVYINRNQIGAVVGVQPFGGQGLSGTGPKAGGPHYLARFVTEKTRTNNVTAIGGNTTLLSLGE